MGAWSPLEITNQKGMIIMPVPPHDFTGEVYGDLTVISRGPDYIPKNPKSKNTRRHIRWNCQCICGKEMLLETSDIRNPKNQICHHYDTRSINIGDRFGHLTVLCRADDHISPSGVKKPQWICGCDCGNEVIVQQQILKRHRKTHCGCLRNTYKPINDKIIYDLSGKYGIGITRRNEIFLFDLEDFDKIKDFSWYYNKEGYLQASTPKRLQNQYPKIILFHRLVMDSIEKDVQIDHIVHTGQIGERHVDNRKSNLRYVTHAQNMQNRGRRINNTTGETNIQIQGKRILVQITKDGNTYRKTFSINQYDEAIAWRNAKRQELFGDADFFVNNP